jgi:hypothetical protein
MEENRKTRKLEDQRREQWNPEEQTRFIKRLTPIIELMSPEQILEYFGTTDYDAIWKTLNTAPNHREGVVEWVDAMISAQLSKELQSLSSKAERLKIQDTYRTSKGTTMRRHIEQQQSPSCQIDDQQVSDHWRWMWAREEKEFEETDERS